MAPSLRDRLLTPQVARAMTSPSAILLAGAGASAAILSGAAVLAPVAAAAAWAARVAASVPRGGPRRERIDPRSIGQPWQGFVQEALDSRRRFDQAVQRAEAGPLRNRLTEIGDRIDTGVQEVWRIARRGDALTVARKGLNAAEIRRELDAVQRDASQPWASGESLGRAAEALTSQLATVERLERVIADTHSRLRLLDARLDEAVARTLELSVQASDVADLGGLGADVDGLVGEMEALRQAVEEVGATHPGTTRPGTA